jgi:hypothetical protein
MLKIIIRTFVILLVSGIVAGGIYLFAQNGGMNILSAVGGNTRFARGGRNGFGQPPGGDRQPPNGDFYQQRPFGDGGRDGFSGFSLASLSGVLMQAGKVALITVAVILIQFLVRLIRRRRKPASPLPA